ncbi:phosphate ABC transporter permease PstA [Halosimplex sp. J119]
MSEAFETGAHASLVSDESSRYDRGLDGIVALGVLSFALGLISLIQLIPLDASGGALGESLLVFLAVVVGAVGAVGLASQLGVVPVTSDRVRGIASGLIVGALALTVVAYAAPITFATLLGVVMLVEAAGVAAAGVASRTGAVDTSPDASAGLLAGFAFGAAGLFLGAAIGGTLVGFDTPLWRVVAVGTGLLFWAVTVFPREDIGSTLPPALIVGALGLTVTTAVLGVGWEWNPDTLSGGFTGGAVVPLFVLFGAILASWAAAKSRAGFGARGRQYGAFLVIDLVAVMTVSAMVAIVVFVTLKGVGYAFHDLRIGALAVLVALVPVLMAAVRIAATPSGRESWHGGVRLLARVAPLSAVGALAVVLVGTLVTGDALRYPYTYTVQVNRESVVLDTSVAVTPEPAVGSLLLVISGGLTFAYFYRRYGSLRNVGTPSAFADRLDRATPAALAALAVLTGLFVLAGPSPFGLPLGATLGLAAVAAAALGGLALTIVALSAVVSGDGDPAARAQSAAPLVVRGVFGGLGLLLGATVLQAASGAVPMLGSGALVPMVTLTAAAACGVLALAVGGRRRSVEDGITRRLLGEEATLGLAGTAGFAALAGLHVWLVGSSFGVLGLTISADGTLSWPMTMQAYIPLGAEPGGIMPAVVGTIWLVGGSTLFAVPLGVGAAVFLTEYAEQGAFTGVVEVATNALWSTPSVVFGLFGAAFLIPRLGGDTSLLAGMFVLGFMLLPLVLITSREAILAVPDEFRDASAALGATQWQTIRSVVLPASMPGIITGGILGVGRVAGETAPLILVLGSTLNATESVHVLGGFRFVPHPPFVANPELLSASASLPTQVWAVIAAGVSGSPSMGWASAFVLLMVVLSFYAFGITARNYFRDKINYE